MEAQQFQAYDLGNVLLKRYVIEEILQCNEELGFRVFQFKDKLLDINCFGFFKADALKEDMAGYARNLQDKAGNDLVILSAKKMEQGWMLIFSKADSLICDINFEEILEVKESANPDYHLNSAINKKYPKALPEETVIKEQYKVIDCLGIGGFGITYLCEDLLLHRIVAVKEYYPQEWVEREDGYVMVKSSRLLQAFQYGMQSFHKEICISAKFIHTPHIVSVFDEVEDNDTIYMVMEFIPGISVGRELRQRCYRPYSEYEVADIMLPILDALEQIHQQGIVHSDISPGNIMHSDGDNFYLIDLGAAKYKTDKKLQMSAAFLKVDFAAPEQYRSARSGVPDGEGEWTDIYALGATMYYLLTGTKATDVISRLNGTNMDIRDGLVGKIPIPWIDIIGKAMELESKKRFLTVSELRKQLINIL